MNDEALPEMLARIRDECGEGVMLAFARAFGGGHIYVPEAMTDDHPIAKAVGAGPARKIAAMYAREQITVPLGPVADGRRRSAEIARMVRAGRTDMEIWAALKPHCHIETIRRVRRRLGVRDPNQHDLFAKRG